jgi:hypothetical protein
LEGRLPILRWLFESGFGIVFGDLKRTQAHPGGTNPNPNTGEGFVICSGQGSPDATYCGSDNDHYAGYTEPSWADGGSKPVIFPWLALQTGLRYKPHRNFAARLDAGFGTSGFFIAILRWTFSTSTVASSKDGR